MWISMGFMNGLAWARRGYLTILRVQCAGQKKPPIQNPRAPSTMPTITLPGGSTRTFAEAVDGSAVAKSIGPRLERDAVAVRVNGKLTDLTLPIEGDASVEIVTRTSKDGLELLRHDAAHVLAEAVKELY